MSIRLGNSCVNCKSLTGNSKCKVHGVVVATSYTCDSFEMKAVLKNDANCGTCARYEESSCANPHKAASNMLCSSWAPQNASA